MQVGNFYSSRNPARQAANSPFFDEKESPAGNLFFKNHTPDIGKIANFRSCRALTAAGKTCAAATGALTTCSKHDTINQDKGFNETLQLFYPRTCY
ncbi:MAG: hypothetical protein NXI25_01270 [bacterium]|nr:hypothetical protein [bacterium]